MYAIYPICEISVQFSEGESSHLKVQMVPFRQDFRYVVQRLPCNQQCTTESQ